MSRALPSLPHLTPSLSLTLTLTLSLPLLLGGCLDRARSAPADPAADVDGGTPTDAAAAATDGSPAATDASPAPVDGGPPTSDDAGQSRACTVTNAHGACQGTQTRQGESWSDCDAPVPAAERCNGLDDDCDGDADEGACSASGTLVHLRGDRITVEGGGATVDGTTVTLLAAGTYTLDGTLDDGQVRVDTQAAEPVELILAGVDLHCATSAPLYVVAAEQVAIFLAAGSTNRLSDGASYLFAVVGEDEPSAALFSKADLEIGGDGSLTVEGNYNDGIASKDGLTISGGTIEVTAADDGLRGKDDVTIEGGEVTLTATGDGISSDNADDATRGFIAIADGTVDITAGGDGLAAQTSVTISGGRLRIVAGGGSAQTVGADESAKGIKGVSGVTVLGGALDIDAADDGLHSNDRITISGGTLAIASGDDGAHADVSLTVRGGTIDVTRSYEGLESAVIDIDGGTIHLVARDDGLNAGGGADGSGGEPGGWGGPGGGGVANSYLIHLRGGYLAIDAGGDGVDSNGSVEMTAGTVLVNGPTSNGNGPLDIGDGGSYYFRISGGLLVATGSSGMAIAPSTSSTQRAVLIRFSTSQRAGNLIHLQASADGTPLLSYAPSKTYQSIVYSSPSLSAGASYQVYLGGSATGVVTDSLYGEGVYTPGSLYTTFTASSVITTIGGGGGGPGH